MKSITQIFLAAAMLLFVHTAFADTQDRHLSGFNGIQLSASYDVYITQSSNESVRVEAPGNVIGKIITEVQGGVLKIYNKSQSGWGDWSFSGGKKILVYISAKDIASIGISGSGNVYFKEGISTNNLKIRVSGSGDVFGKLNSKNLELSISGSGDVKLNGRADVVNASVSGSGDFSARNLQTQSTTIRVSGSGDATVYASDKLDASVSGSGDISYGGSPKHVATATHGSGDIHRF